MTLALDIQSVTKQYGSFVALHETSFQIPQGEFFGLLGPNGAGKTTLISMIAGLAKPSSGNLLVAGYDVIKDYRKARRSLGVVPQELVFDPFFTVRESLDLTSGYYGIKGNGRWVEEILEGLGLADKADTNTRQLSGGMKRRLLVAQALVHRPPVILLDEPTAGVDVELRKTLWEFIQRLNTDGHTVVLTTHYLEEAQELCSRIGMLKQGRMVALEPTASLLNRFSAGRMMVRISGAALPESLVEQIIERDGNRYILRVDTFDLVELSLAMLRQAGCVIDDLEVSHADLEDVFVSIMQEAT